MEPSPEALAKAADLLSPFVPFVATHRWLAGALDASITRVAQALTEQARAKDAEIERLTHLLNGQIDLTEFWKRKASAQERADG